MPEYRGVLQANAVPDIPVNEPIIAYVRRRLGEHKGRWPQIADDTKVPYGTITNIANGKSPNPELSSVQPLIDWFRAHDEMLEKLRKS